MNISLAIGQLVPMPDTPDGVGQISDLGRTRVELLYLRNGRICRRRVRAAEVAGAMRRSPLLLSVNNLLRRGVIPRAKTYEIAPPPVARGGGDRTGVAHGQRHH